MPADATPTTPMRRGALLDAALAYVARGWPVHPLNAVCEPATRRGFRDASLDAEQVRRWWTDRPDARIGLVTGVAFAVLDIDHPTLDGDVAAELPEFEILGPQVRTASGGWHIYTRPCGIGRRIKFARHCDWLDGDGYVVAPPSQRDANPSKGKCAGTYEWVVGGPDSELYDPPLAVVLAAARMRPEPTAPQVTASTQTVATARLACRWNPAGLIGTVAAATQGERNQRLFWAACRIGEDVASGTAERSDADAACLELERVAVMVGLGASEARKTIASGYSNGLTGKGRAA